MRKHSLCAGITLGLFAAVAFPAAVSANSSWYWISETRPFDILPWVILITLAAETIAINFIPRIRQLPKVFCIVTLANLVSFALPYLIQFLLYHMQGFDFDKYINGWPSYIIGILYGLLTVAAELPLIYFLLRKHADSRIQLILTILLVNIATTGIVACFERVFCVGEW